jgi:NAD(P)-dependent dehydrogenase (short-subunit alcohol dehydrogenase family)
MEINLASKIAIVTGAAMGIGLRCAQVIAESGARVAIVDVQKEDVIAKAIASLKGTGHKGYHANAANVSDINTTVERIRKEMGEIDILVNNAGVDLGYPRKAEEVTEAEWDKLHTVNSRGLFFFSQAVARQSMIPRKSGSIVNMASAVGMVGAPLCIPYNTSKAVVVQVTRSTAVEWGAYNVRVNAVAPTWVENTQISSPLMGISGFKEHELGKIPLNRFATFDDVANAVCFLASDACPITTGSILAVDGGWTAQ